MKGRVAAWHRWLGWVLTIPLIGWLVSAAAMTLVTMNAPNGLAGVYRLNPYNSVDIRLDSATITPTQILAHLKSAYGIDRLYWLRLQSRGSQLWYVAKPTPTALALTFDAVSGKRLDPLSDSLLAVVAAEALIDSPVAGLTAATEYNRYYDVERIPAVWADVSGTQPARLILSRDEGRTLRRLNVETQRFDWWYRTFHVNQFTANMGLWTTLLYACALGVLLLTAFGYLLFWWRRPRASASDEGLARSAQGARARSLHRKLGVVGGGILSIQLLVGAYLWLSLGPLEDPFRGKASFNATWAAGFATQLQLATPASILRLVSAAQPNLRRPIQAIEWRMIGTQPVWAITTRLDEPPLVYSIDGRPLGLLSPMAAGALARQEVTGTPAFTYIGSSSQLYMDLNRPVPTYQFRFDDPGQTDVFVSQATGQIIQRRPRFWRLFGPFLDTHTFSITGRKAVDTTLLAAFQLLVLGIIVTGLIVQFSPFIHGKRS
ncbi:MAG: hypothetical protein IBJ19_14195 [Gemmatimonadaceae bacterium]|nr:hypothetical protein [Gemmatimonadaceae bacterium]